MREHSRRSAPGARSLLAGLGAVLVLGACGRPGSEPTTATSGQGSGQRAPTAASASSPRADAGVPVTASAEPGAALAPAAPEPELTPEAVMAHVRALTADALQGRLAGSAGEKAAADYVVHELEASGVGALPPDGLRVQPFSLPPRAGQAAAERSQSRNVLGLVPGAGSSFGREVVVVGAHFDHVGVRNGQIYRGAEDNASGVAVTLQVARALQRERAELGRSVIVAFFGAEEPGLLGSSAFLRERPAAAADIVVMVNVDMVGRLLADRTGLGLPMRALGIDATRSVGVLGTKGQPALRAIVEAACASAGIQAVKPEELPGPISRIVESYSAGRGDNWPFEYAGIPTLFFSSGESDDYHQPSDVADKLEPELMARRARAIHRTLKALSKVERAELVAPKAP